MQRDPQQPTILVACVKRKATTPQPAGDLYASVWFRKAHAFAMAHGASWHILSAKHGLLDPATVIDLYDETLLRMTAHERQAWGARTAEQIIVSLDPAVPLVVLAGRLYRDPLLPKLQAAGFDILVPMAGLGIGQQLQWLDRHTNHASDS